jgi:lipopolysaccharide export system protein LptA
VSNASGPRLLALALAVAAPSTAAFAEGAADLFSGFQSQSNDPVQVDAQSLEVYEQGQERIELFTGNVVVVRGDTTLKAASIKLHQDLKGKSDAFTKIEADGGITVKSKDQTLTGKTAVVDMTANSILVSGGVVLSQGQNVISGTSLSVDLNTGRARLEGNTVRGVFTPGSTGTPSSTGAISGH